MPSQWSDQLAAFGPASDLSRRRTACCVCWPSHRRSPSSRDVPALEGTIAQLRHTGRALQLERDQLQQQLQQLEEANQQMAAELSQLTDKNGRWAGWRNWGGVRAATGLIGTKCPTESLYIRSHFQNSPLMILSITRTCSCVYTSTCHGILELWLISAL